MGRVSLCYRPVFISLGRGSVVDEAGLLKHASKLGGIAMDVFGEEPLPETSKLWDLPNILISPHNADFTEEMVEETVATLAERYREYSEGRAFSYVVDMQVGY